MKNNVTIKTVSIDSYFTGTIKKGFFPFKGERWYVSCESYAGGNVPILDVIEFCSVTREGLISKLKDFVQDHKLIMKIN